MSLGASYQALPDRWVIPAISYIYVTTSHLLLDVSDCLLEMDHHSQLGSTPASCSPVTTFTSQPGYWLLYTEDFGSFPQSLQENVGLLNRIKS